MERGRPDIPMGPRNREVYETRGGNQLGFVQRESDRLAPSGMLTHQGDTIYSPNPRSDSVAMRQVFHPSTGRKSGEAYRSPYGTTTSMTVEPEWYAQRGYDFSYDPGVFDYPMMGESTDLYFNNYQRGGSVNPHEETTRAAREWSPREPEYYKGPAPYNPDRELKYYKGPAPYNPDREQKYYPVSPSSAMERVWNTGLTAIDKGKEILNQYEVFLPDDYDDDMLKWELNNKYGQFDIGFGDNQAMFNWNVTPWWNK